MPPKRGKKAAATAAPPKPALEDCKVALSGQFGKHSQSDLKKKVESLGGTVASSVTNDTTHLIASDGDFKKPSLKVAKALSLSISIVGLDWLLATESSGTRAKEEDYALDPEDGDENEDEDDAVDDDDDADDAQPAASQPIPIRGKGKPAKSGTARKRSRPPSPSPQVLDDKETKPKKAKVEIAELETKIGDGQVAKRKDIRIPLDEGCPHVSSTVYIAPDGVIYDASLNQTNIGNNNNKFYRIQLLVDSNRTYKTWTRWGRVGDHGQTATLGGGSLEDALKQFEKKFKDKSGLSWADRGKPFKTGKYVFVERNYNADSDDEDESEGATGKTGDSDWVSPESKLDEEVQELVKLIFNQRFFDRAMSDLNYDANKLPLGKLSKATIKGGFQVLKDLSALLDNPSRPAAEVEELSNAYYSLIPHAFGRNRPPVISDQQMVKREIELLESLSDMKDAALIMKLDRDRNIHPLDKQYEGLKLNEMTPLDPKTQEFAMLEKYLVETRGHTHAVNYKVESIFRIERQGETERFMSAYGKQPQNRRLLWHGSRCTNFGGILSQGLRIAPPEAPVNGYMFDKGIYLADMSSKSANYCCSSLSDNTALLLLCEAELGDPMQELMTFNYNAAEEAKKKGMLSTWGQGQYGPTKWRDAKAVHPSLAGVQIPDISVTPGRTNIPGANSLWYNEYICYDVAQVRLRYLFRVKM